MTHTGTTPLADPGWYLDPYADGEQRWWDGSRWTGRVRVSTGARGEVVRMEEEPIAASAHPVAVALRRLLAFDLPQQSRARRAIGPIVLGGAAIVFAAAAMNAHTQRFVLVSRVLEHFAP